MEGLMVPERDLEVEIRRIRENRETSTQQDTKVLVSAWRAIARSHRLLDKDVYRLGSGELTVRAKPQLSSLQVGVPAGGLSAGGLQ
jgi:hypothetical protein